MSGIAILSAQVVNLCFVPCSHKAHFLTQDVESQGTQVLIHFSTLHLSNCTVSCIPLWLHSAASVLGNWQAQVLQSNSAQEIY